MWLYLWVICGKSFNRVNGMCSFGENVKMTLVLDKLAKTCYVRYVAISFGNFTVFEASFFFVFVFIQAACAVCLFIFMIHFFFRM